MFISARKEDSAIWRQNTGMSDCSEEKKLTRHEDSVYSLQWDSSSLTHSDRYILHAISASRLQYIEEAISNNANDAQNFLSYPAFIHVELGVMLYQPKWLSISFCNLPEVLLHQASRPYTKIYYIRCAIYKLIHRLVLFICFLNAENPKKN